jgi:hypothetical protein
MRRGRLPFSNRFVTRRKIPLAFSSTVRIVCKCKPLTLLAWGSPIALTNEINGLRHILASSSLRKTAGVTAGVTAGTAGTESGSRIPVPKNRCRGFLEVHFLDQTHMATTEDILRRNIRFAWMS